MPDKDGRIQVYLSIYLCINLVGEGYARQGWENASVSIYLSMYLVGEGYARQGWENASVRETKLARLMEQGKLPDRVRITIPVWLRNRKISAGLELFFGPPGLTKMFLILPFNISGKLSIIQCDNYYYKIRYMFDFECSYTF